MLYPVLKAQIRAVVSMIEEKATVMRGGGQKCLYFLPGQNSQGCLEPSVDLGLIEIMTPPRSQNLPIMGQCLPSLC